MKTILVVDDEPAILDLVIMLLGDEGYGVLPAVVSQCTGTAGPLHSRACSSIAVDWEPVVVHAQQDV